MNCASNCRDCVNDSANQTDGADFQTSSLPYRRLPVGRALTSSEIQSVFCIQRGGNPRYSRLEGCATKPRYNKKPAPFQARVFLREEILESLGHFSGGFRAQQRLFGGRVFARSRTGASAGGGRRGAGLGILRLLGGNRTGAAGGFGLHHSFFGAASGFIFAIGSFGFAGLDRDRERHQGCGEN
jgi:hypothetical protein